MSSESRIDLTFEYDVVNKKNNKWGIAQVQSSISIKIAVNFENIIKKVTNINQINL